MFQKGMSGEDTIVGLNNRGRNLRGRIDGESKLGFLAIVHWKTFQQKGTKTRTSASTYSIENQKALETSAVVRKLSDAVQAYINNFFSNWIINNKANIIIIWYDIQQGKYVMFEIYD